MPHCHVNFWKNFVSICTWGSFVCEWLHWRAVEFFAASQLHSVFAFRYVSAEQIFHLNLFSLFLSFSPFTKWWMSSSRRCWQGRRSAASSSQSLPPLLCQQLLRLPLKCDMASGKCPGGNSMIRFSLSAIARFVSFPAMSTSNYRYLPFAICRLSFHFPFCQRRQHTKYLFAASRARIVVGCRRRQPDSTPSFYQFQHQYSLNT